ncbi:MAG: protein translocase subunit SecDF [Gemmatimonadaceae bacterium]|nr:protein translocase subunit SecDF [Chitinophagaceae bacterium]
MRILVAIFAGFLILISAYQLSFTWFVNKHENAMADKAKQYVNRAYPAAEVKYPGNQDIQTLYRDTIAQAEKERLRRLLDSTRDKSITWFGHSYQKAKENELLLGLDLQGGINVTLDIELTGLIKALSNNSTDPKLVKALDEAKRRKVNSDADFISLFIKSFQDVNPGQKLAALFSNSTRNKLKSDASDNATENYIREQANAAMQQTYGVLSKRIDKFGVSQPNMNLDENRGIITVELAGANDPERVRKYLQSTANLQFWEVYNISEIAGPVQNADKALEEYLNGGKKTDTSAPVVAAVTPDTTATTPGDSGLGAILNKKADTAKGTLPTAAADANKNKLLVAFYPAIQQAQQMKNPNDRLPDYVGIVPIGDTGTINSYLANPVVARNFPTNIKFLWGKEEIDDAGVKQNYLRLYAIKTIPGQEKARIEGDMIVDAEQNFDPTTSEVIVTMSMNKTGGKLWADMTGASKGKPIAIVLDDIVYSAPYVENAITGGESRITMGRGKNANYAVQEAQDLAAILKSGKLNAPAKIVQEQTVGPTLGAEAVRGGSMAFLISFGVIFILMLVYYNTAGWVANIALILNLLFTVGVLSSFGATLTAAGIAGLVLTIGMAVDTNVIIFERIKDELTRGKSYQQAVKDGYRRSLAPVLDAHVTTFLTAAILFYFGLGPVLGFATTQMLGIVLSLFCGILVSRLITDFWTNKNRHFKYFTSVSRGVFKHAAFKFIEYRKVAYAISVVVLLIGVAAFFHGFKYGVEFKGGRSFIVNFHKPVNIEDIRKDLQGVFVETPVIKTYGSNSKLDITTDYKVAEQNADEDVRKTLFTGLKKYLPANLGFAEFSTINYVEGSKKVDPTISDDLKKGAQWATFWSLLIICVYIFIRFRDWRYSLGTIVALLHDILVTVAVFSFFKDIVPFPLEIDQHFIAAILTVIGFSMNDTVIVFDRVREYSHTMKGESKKVVINKAINDTLSRTLMTSLTVFLTLLILFLVGGEVTKGFAFAMLIGVVTGTYSSIFVAAPILIDFAKDKPLGEAGAPAKEEKPKLIKPTTLAK